MVILSTEVYDEVNTFIHQFRGLSIECGVALREKFPNLSTDTLDSILARSWQSIIKLAYPNMMVKSRRLLRE